MLLPEEVGWGVWGVFVPLIAGVSAACAAWLPRRGTEPTPAAGPQPPRTFPGETDPLGWSAFALAAGLCFAVYMVTAGKYGDVAWPPTRVQAWWLPIAGALGVVALVEAFGRLYAPSAWLVRVAVVTAAMLLPVRSGLMSGWTNGEAVAKVGGFALMALAAWWAFERLGRVRGALPPILAVIALTTSSIALIRLGHIHMAILCATLCAVLGPVALVGLIRPRACIGPAAGAAAGMAGVFWFHGYTLGQDVPVLLPVLLALGAVVAGLVAPWRTGEAAPQSRAGRLGVGAMKVALAAAPGVAAVVWAVLIVAREEAGAGGW